MVDERLLVRLTRLIARFLTAGGNSVGVAVTAAATSVTITFPRSEYDTAYGVVATPNWGTTVYVTGKTVTGCTVNFGTAAPGSATVDLIIFRSK